MMTVFVDTNILIDLLCERESFVQSARMLFAYGYSGRLTLVLSSLSLVNAVYIARKYGYIDVREKLDDITEFVEVVDLRKEVAKRALTCEWKDYEDAVQYMSAIKENADCIVTRNKKDFWKSVIPVYTIEELMSLM
ncbi:MAG: type II toxin-antitoxin system VapC family toxin [Candidatus Limimorpha sp.]